MQRRVSNDDIFAIADLLDMLLKRDFTVGVKQLSGVRKATVCGLPGLWLPIKMEVLDSGVYEQDGYVGVSVHLMGALCAVILVSSDSAATCEYCQVWLLDRTKLSHRGTDVFPASWSRAAVYAAIEDGVVCGYRKGAGKAAKWVLVEEARKELHDYLERAQAGVVHVSAEDFLPVLAEDDHVISNKYRTIGPRGV